ncbi:MAG: acyltransferase [Akkermansia sp.]|nr:acyltransferase [Akkermansia sp.]
MNQLLSQSRASLMGLSMVSIIMFHQLFVGGPIARLFHLVGHLGVDAFLFVSGFGVYYSIYESRRQNQPISMFYMRRFWRIFPTCILAGVCFLYFWMSSIPGLYYPYSANFVSAFVGLDVWYIRTIVIFYLISPLLYNFLQGVKSFMFAWLLMLLITPVLAQMFRLGISFLFEHSYFMQQTIVWTIERFPAFFFGMFFAHRKFEVREFLNAKFVWLAIFCFSLFSATAVAKMLGIGKNDDLCGYLYALSGSYVLIVPFLPIAVILSGYFTKVCIFARSTVEWIGKYSLELFLAHSAIFPFCLKEFGGGVPVFITALLFSFIFAIILKYVASVCVKVVRGLSHVRK